MTVYITERDSNKRWYKDQLKLTGNPASIKLNPEKTFQEMIGFGGAFTEASGYNLSRVDQSVRTQALKDYFDPENGLGYTIGRVSIHGCDFSLSSYSYIEENDTTLETFDISRDFNYVIPLIKDAEEVAGQPIQILASPWSPPAFMKTNNSMIKGGELKDEYRQLWADYFVKFIEEYEKAGVTIWGLTVQNEPAAVQRWDSCIYSGEQERDFVKNYLGPTLKASNYSHVNLLIWDHNRDIMVERAKAVLEDEEAAQYVWGTAFHWYVSEEFENVGAVHDLFPEKGLLFTEGCQEGGVHFDTFDTGERYARNMIGDFNNWCQGYLDWNLFLDNTGGPNHVNNLCDAPIILDIFPEKIVKQSSYYYIGHFSKFVKPGSYRIGVENSSPLQIVSFLNPDRSIATILLNETDEQIDEVLELNGTNMVVSMNPHSIQTILNQI
jgi:glucosylceramidase